MHAVPGGGDRSNPCHDSGGKLWHKPILAARRISSCNHPCVELGNGSSLAYNNEAPVEISNVGWCQTLHMHEDVSFTLQGRQSSNKIFSHINDCTIGAGANRTMASSTCAGIADLTRHYMTSSSGCYTEKASPTRHRPERQHNARSNRKKQCSPNETKPYSKPTLLRKRQTTPTTGHTPRRWFLGVALLAMCSTRSTCCDFSSSMHVVLCAPPDSTDRQQQP